LGEGFYIRTSGDLFDNTSSELTRIAKKDPADVKSVLHPTKMAVATVGRVWVSKVNLQALMFEVYGIEPL
jgi:hypothetical protein